MTVIDLGMGEWETIAGGGLSVDVFLERMPFLDRDRVLELNGSGRQVIGTEKFVDGAGITHERQTVQVESDIERSLEAKRTTLNLSVKNWRNVQGKDGVPVQFTLDTLLKVMAKYPAWADALVSRVLEINGLKAEASPAGEEGDGGPKSPSGPGGPPA